MATSQEEQTIEIVSSIEDEDNFEPASEGDLGQQGQLENDLSPLEKDLLSTIDQKSGEEDNFFKSVSKSKSADLSSTRSNDVTPTPSKRTKPITSVKAKPVKPIASISAKPVRRIAPTSVKKDKPVATLPAKPTKKTLTPKSKEERKKADDKYKPKKQFIQLASKISQAVENFKEGRFRVWSGSTYQENQVLELTYNAIENLRKGFKDLDHPQFDTTHRALDLIVKEAEESGDYDEALGKVLALTKERVTSQKETTTPTPSQKTRPKRKQEVFNLESSS
jgi:hypothetical protein